jgi:hypothetical protein
MTHRPFASTHRRLSMLAGLTAAAVAVLGLAAPAHARPGPPLDDAPEVGGPTASQPPASQPADETGGGPAAGPRPPTDTIPETEPVADPDHRPNKPSPFDVILEVEVPDAGEPVVNAQLDVVELQAATDREPTSLTIKWSDGDEQVYDLTGGQNTSFSVAHDYDRPTADRTYTVIAWVVDNEGGVGIDSQDVTIEAQYDVTLRPIKFSPWGAGNYDCDPWPLQGDGDFTFGYRLDWADVHIEKEADFDLGAGDTKTLLPDGVTVRGVTRSDFARLQYWWREHDLPGWPLKPASFDGSAPAPKFIDLQPHPDESPRSVDFVSERDGCEMHIVTEIVTRPAA